MADEFPIAGCGQLATHWYDGPWVNMLGQGVTVSDTRVIRNERQVNVVADLNFDIKEGEGVEWMIVVVGLYSVNSMLHMESTTGLINSVVRTEPNDPCSMAFQFKDNSSRQPFEDVEARVIAALVRDWEAEKRG